ncbi:RagB/SusD family nutrient uptake outer membrane protein [Dyadobacter sp. CY261]|uniref:RagB/SusD family nutrient uptake outer membrane protein n=1 Tax=Dyadobacter sp. CY261 TaxID=2907203 RepID=UPI001F2EF52A|nr:RagB/SusD family nutrient uptake outer membrane protein [Dyadobacter sp. CY261]MCF0070202.1 RagB/SusD family nutrient uptake outer membrane protein [Dyadobacter sp. CY261]
MKRYKLLPALITALTLLGGCESQLDKVNPNAVTSENYFKTAAELEKGVNAAYTTLNGSYLVGNCYIWLHDLRSDDFVGTTLADDRGEILRGTLGVNNSYVERVWKGFYIVIHRANVVINNTVTDNEALKNRVVAEAKFLRAFSYFELASLWGGVPLITKPVSDFNGFVPRSTQQAVYEAAINDLKEAAEMLPATYDARDNGRATKGAANALLGRIYMQIGDFANAKTYLEKVRSSGLYSLVDDSNDNFREESEFNKESIFECIFSPNPSAAEDEGDDYAQGLYRESTNGTRQYDMNTGNGVVLPAPDLKKDFEASDVRKKAAYYETGDIWAGGEMTQESWKKYTLSYKNATPGNVASAINRRMIRYAEVLLMLAECENETGSLANAISRLNDIRNRPDLKTAKLAQFPNTAFPCKTKDDVMKAIIHERKVELAGEQVRNRDILRWRASGKLALAGSDPITYFQANRHELLPIPQSEIDRNIALGTGGVPAQNPGY